MAELIRNGNFERDLDEWTILPVEYRGIETMVRVQAAPEHPRGESLYFESAHHVSIEQSFPWSPHATDGELSLQVFGYAAHFYVNVHYEDGGMDDGNFYGHFLDGWERLTIPVADRRPIARLELFVLVAVDFYIDDISMQGTNTELKWQRPESKRPPEEFNEPPLREVLERRMIGIEKQINRLTKELVKQQIPDLSKEVDKRMEEQKNTARTSEKARIK